MHEFYLDITDDSIWITSTASDAAKSLGFYVTETGRFTAGKKYFTRRDSMDGWLMLYTISGAGMLSTSGLSFKLESGDCALISCGDFHAYSTVSAPWEFFWAHFSGNAVEGMCEAIRISDKLVTQISDTKRFEEVFSNIIALAKGVDISSVSKSALDIHELLHMMLEKTAQEKSPAISKIISYIKRHYLEQITIDDMLKDVPVSKYHMIRLFKQATGITPYHYLLNTRINESKILLRTTDMTISQIAFAVGFLDESNFIYQFKKQTGIKPTNYRKDFS